MSGIVVNVGTVRRGRRRKKPHGIRIQRTEIAQIGMGESRFGHASVEGSLVHHRQQGENLSRNQTLIVARADRGDCADNGERTNCLRLIGAGPRLFKNIRVGSKCNSDIWDCFVRKRSPETLFTARSQGAYAKPREEEKRMRAAPEKGSHP